MPRKKLTEEEKRNRKNETTRARRAAAQAAYVTNFPDTSTASQAPSAKPDLDTVVEAIATAITPHPSRYNSPVISQSHLRPSTPPSPLFSPKSAAANLADQEENLANVRQDEEKDRISDSSPNSIMMGYPPTQSTLRSKSRIPSPSFSVHDSPSRPHTIHTYPIIRPLSLRPSTAHGFASAVVHPALIDPPTSPSSPNPVGNIPGPENDRIPEEIHNSGAKDSSLSESRAEEDSDEDDSNWLPSQNTAEPSSSESIPEEISHVAESTSDDDAPSLESQPHTVEEHFQVALDYMERSIDNDCFCSCSHPSSLTHAHSMAQLSSAINLHLPRVIDSDFAPLHLDSLLPRDGRHNDYRSVDWRTLLSNADDIPQLDLSLSETHLRNTHTTDNLTLRRTWDVDGLILHARSLAICREGFKLAYCAPFLQRITESPKVTINGYKVQKEKQLRLGFGVRDGGYNYSMHVLFPHMPRTANDTTHLTNSLQETWIDQIVLPALWASTDSNVHQRHPRSFADAFSRAHVRQEAYLQSSGQPLDLLYDVPKSALRAFWRRIRHRANATEDFREPTLVVSGWNQKLLTQRPNARQTRSDYLEHLDHCFDLHDRNVDPAQAWVDIGVEDVVASPTSPGITLLWKSPCLHLWKTCFHDPYHQKPRVKVIQYPFMLTRDAGGASVKLDEANYLRAQGGLIYHKAYNLAKDLFSSIIKEHLPFNNPYFEGLPYSQSELLRWHRINRDGGLAFSAPDMEAASTVDPSSLKGRQIKAYVRTKQRISGAIRAARAQSQDFGLRKEYRQTLESYRRQELSDSPTETDLWWVPPPSTPSHRSTSPSPAEPPRSDHSPVSTSMARNPPKLAATNLDDHSQSESAGTTSEARGEILSTHRPYWILPTDEVLDFIAATLNRYLYPLEALAAQAQSGPNGLPAATSEDQISYGQMATALVRTITLSLGGMAPETRSELWLDEFNVRTRPHDVTAVGDAENDSPMTTRKIKRLGLGLKDCIRQNGIASFPADMIFWEGLPVFKPHFRKRLHLTQDGLQGQFLKNPAILTDVQRENRLLAHFRQMARAAGPLSANWIPQIRRHKDHPVTAVLCTAAELSIQSYMLQVLDLLQSRLTRGMTKAAKTTAIAEFMAPLTDDERAGLVGFSHSMISRLLGFEPHVVAARRSPATDAHSAKQSYFGQYHDDLRWRSRLRGLFQWNDHPGKKARLWENNSFRNLTRRLHSIIASELRHGAEDVFMQVLSKRASTLLWIIPQYDYDKLSVMTKASKHHAAKRQQTIQGLDDLQKTNWLLACLSTDCTATLRHFRNDNCPPAAHRHCVDDLRQKSAGATQMVMSQQGLAFPTRNSILDPAWIGASMELVFAKSFRLSLAVDMEQDSDPDSTESEPSDD